MSHRGTTRTGTSARRWAWLVSGLIVWAPAPTRAWQGEPAGAAATAPAPDGPAVEAAPNGAPAVPSLAPGVQVVRLEAPEGIGFEVVSPAPEPITVEGGVRTDLVGLRVGTAYRLKITNLPYKPGVEFFPVVEVVGHLHRPEGLDPTRFPIRIVVTDDDLADAAERGLLVTHVVYLEDPEQALPASPPRNQIPTVTLGAAEDPLRVAAALGRVMAIVRVGGRVPTADEMAAGPGMDVNVTGCPFVGPSGGRCDLPCGPARGTPPPPGRPWVPADEYLCDGGDHAEPAHFGGDGALRGIDPRDAVIQFRDDRRPRVLPTNVVCIYAPRFAAVRKLAGPSQAERIDTIRGVEFTERQITVGRSQGPRRFTLNQAPEINRHRSRPSEAKARVFAGEHSELRVLGLVDTHTIIGGGVQVEAPVMVKARQLIAANRTATPPLTIKTAESAVVTGIVRGAGEQVSTWKPQETVGVELPPNKLGLQVLKRVSADVAEPGDSVTFTISYRNMGNVPIDSVSVIDSLMPRLEYVKGSATGPAGTVFSAEENRAGATELRWDFPKPLAPNAEGSVTFDARVR